MERFNNTTLFTGYLKQLLHNFNLPKYRIYTEENRKYFERNKKESPEILETVTQYYDEENKKIVYPTDIRYIPYIRNGMIQEYIDGNWVDVGNRKSMRVPHIHHYNEGTKILNYTKNLKITTNSYDPYTHEYLGDYLRFKRDYNNLNLMPLYNCFSNRQCDSLNLKLNINNSVTSFNTDDIAYKIYMIPVKLFKEYTIAIDSSSQIEMCCGLYGAYQDTCEKFKNLPSMTYMTVSNSYFAQPFLFSKLLALTAVENKSLLIELAQNEDSLKLFLKVPATNNSTIVILEGNYLGWNDYTTEKDGKMKTNSVALNFEYIDTNINFDLKTPLQLLNFNTTEQHPFADSLIEYLLDNAITPIDEINDNISRVQDVIERQTLTTTNGELIPGEKIFTYYYSPKVKGMWDDNMRYAIYDYMTTKKIPYEDKQDILGYVNKNVEKYYKYYDTQLKMDISLSSIDDTDLEDK